MSRIRTRSYNYQHEQRNSLRQKRAVGQSLEIAHSRLAIVAACFCVCFLAITAQLVYLMLLKGDGESRTQYTAAAQNSLYRSDIVDRNGEVLATTIQSASLFADPALVLDIDETVQKLTSIFPKLNTERLRKKLASDKRFVWIKRNLTPRQQYEANALGLPGVDFLNQPLRVYPHGKTSAHLIGFTDVDGNGLAGIERSFDAPLKTSEEPLALSLDIRLQDILYSEVRHAAEKHNVQGGAGIILNAKSGEVLAGVSYPSFNPTHAGRATSDQLFNRLTLGAYEMGSTFKIFNAAISLDTGNGNLRKRYDTSKPLRIANYTVSDFKEYGDNLSLTEVMMYSSNIGSAKMAAEFGLTHQQRYFDKFGLLARSDIEVPEVVDPILPGNWNEVSLRTLAFGYGLAVSPVQLAAGVASVLNGGTYIPTTLLKNHGGDGMVYPPHQTISESSSMKLRRILNLVVQEGTGSKVKNTGYMVGGKTGTSYISSSEGGYGKQTLSSFIAAFPIHDPQYVVYIMLEAPEGTEDTFGWATGGWTAAPAVNNVVSRMAPVLGIPPLYKSPGVREALLVKGYKTVSHKK